MTKNRSDFWKLGLYGITILSMAQNIENINSKHFNENTYIVDKCVQKLHIWFIKTFDSLCVWPFVVDTSSNIFNLRMPAITVCNFQFPHHWLCHWLTLISCTVPSVRVNHLILTILKTLFYIISQNQTYYYNCQSVFFLIVIMHYMWLSYVTSFQINVN